MSTVSIFAQHKCLICVAEYIFQHLWSYFGNLVTPAIS
jgi:hypothetical protein